VKSGGAPARSPDACTYEKGQQWAAAATAAHSKGDEVEELAGYIPRGIRTSWRALLRVLVVTGEDCGDPVIKLVAHLPCNHIPALGSRRCTGISRVLFPPPLRRTWRARVFCTHVRCSMDMCIESLHILLLTERYASLTPCSLLTILFATKPHQKQCTGGRHVVKRHLRLRLPV